MAKMFDEYLFLTSDFAVHDAAGYHMCAQVGVLGEEVVALVLRSVDPILPGDTLITYRAYDEEVATIVDEDLFKQIRPFGNNPDGTATGFLLYAYLDGFPKKVFDNGKVYPDGSQPFDAECRHKYFDTPATPASTGWGFRFELIGSSYDRDPTARAIGVYSDPECTAYLWTTGALQQGSSDWQTDEEGNPLTVWYTDSWDGDRPDAPKDWHIALLLGSAQEGFQTLPEASDGIHYLFWEHTQGWEPAPGEDWVDTGLTIIGLAGQAYRLSGVPSDLTIGQALRLGPTAETTLKGYWPTLLTPSDYIQIEPYVGVTTGLSVWKWA